MNRRANRPTSDDRAAPDAGRNRGGPSGWDEAEFDELEAVLASLVPRADRLDRDRLLFLAGRASVPPGSERRGFRRALEAWAAGMTAVSLLLAVLLVRADRRLERAAEPMVGVRAKAEQRDVGQDAGRAPSRRPIDVRQGDSVATSPARSRPSALVESSDELRPRVTAWRRAPWASTPDWTRFGSWAEYLRMVDRLLSQGVDPWARAGAAPPASPEKREAVRPYRQWLRMLLDESAQTSLPTSEVRLRLGLGVTS
ncbi:MAG: hypothetical protein GXP27_02325 [Planctomycetes bacterium]|nr:hypothetical protein [Planctomycetota bacterium]